MSLEAIRQMLSQGALEAAGEALSELAETADKSWEVWQLHGDLASRQHRHDEARLAFEQALALNPQAASLHSRLGRLLLDDLALTGALKHFEAARAYDPDALEPTLDLIELALLMGERQQAMVYLKDAMAQLQHLDQHQTQSRTLGARSFALLGQSLWLFGRWPDARAALYQALELDPHCEVAILTLLRLALRRDDQAELSRLLNLLNPDSSNSVQVLYAAGCSQYAQGDLPQARRYWRSAADQGSLAALLQLTLAGPLVSQSGDERRNWQALTLEGARLLEPESLAVVAGLTLEWPLLPQDPECGPELLACLSQSLHRVVPLLETHGAQPRPTETAGRRIGLLTSSLESPERLDWVLALFTESSQTTIDWQLFYLQPGELPAELAPWATRCFQVPDHGEALCRLLQDFDLQSLIYLDLEASLYYTALRRPVGHQFLAPTWPDDPGLPTLSLLPESPVLGRAREPGLASRADWQLPRLGHLYLCPADPCGWLPEWDLTVRELLDQDRRAFILGLRRPGTALHTRVMQRHSESLGDRAHRVRWLDVAAERLPELISLVDLVLEPWESGAVWACFQALAQGVPVLTCPGNSRRSQLSAKLLERMGLSDLVVRDTSALAGRAREWVTDRSGRVMLKERLWNARPRLLETASIIAALEAGLADIVD